MDCAMDCAICKELYEDPVTISCGILFVKGAYQIA